MRSLVWALPAIFLGMQICASADTILPGTQIQVRLDEPIEVHPWEQQHIFPARVDLDVYAKDWDILIPRGAEAEVIVRQAEPGQMALDLVSVTVDGTRYLMDASDLDYNIPGAPETRGSEMLVPAGGTIAFEVQEPLRIMGLGGPEIGS
jgi:hypothetical protein